MISLQMGDGMKEEVGQEERTENGEEESNRDFYFLPVGIKWKFSPPFGLAIYSASDSPIDGLLFDL